MAKPLLIVVAGPTASGKTALAVELANYFHTEILSADSRQCYKELNIGVAKPSANELDLVKHHFINSHSIHDDVNAGIYERYGLETFQKKISKKNIIVLVGGTGLYINALCNGMDNIPEVPANIRAEISENHKLYGIEWLQKKLQEKDPGVFEQIEKQNLHRLMRALEVVMHTGKSITTFRKQEKKKRFFDVIKIALHWNRQTLYNRINLRVDNMMAEGLEKEAQKLIAYKSLNALQTVGYKELFEYFEGNISLKNAVEEIKKNTRHYAKRQITWFKNDETYGWFLPENKEEIKAYIHSFVKRQLL